MSRTGLELCRCWSLCRLRGVADSQALSVRRLTEGESCDFIQMLTRGVVRFQENLIYYRPVQDLELPVEAAPFVAPPPGVPPSGRWLQKCGLAAEHAAAGDFASAMRLLQRRAAILRPLCCRVLAAISCQACWRSASGTKSWQACMDWGKDWLCACI